jgi:hypothetical protein
MRDRDLDDKGLGVMGLKDFSKTCETETRVNVQIPWGVVDSMEIILRIVIAASSNMASTTSR